jgi:excisionase family DNA binding protein
MSPPSESAARPRPSISADDEFLTVAEIAETVRVTQQTVRNWIDQGRLPALHVGRRVRVRCIDFDAFLGKGFTGHGPVSVENEAPSSGIWDGDVPLPEVPNGQDG